MERAIQTFEHHLKTALATVHLNSPLSEWGRLIEHTNITLNLLRASRCNPKLSACTHLFGVFNCQVTPLAPPGARVVAHAHPPKRKSWELNGEVGWCVGLPMKHYRCINIYFPRVRITRDCDVVEFSSINSFSEGVAKGSLDSSCSMHHEVTK